MTNPINTKLPTYEVHSAGAERALREIAGLLKDKLPSGVGFALFLFDYTVDTKLPGNLFYVSSARREDMLRVLKEFIAKQESER